MYIFCAFDSLSSVHYSHLLHSLGDDAVAWDRCGPVRLVLGRQHPNLVVHFELHLGERRRRRCVSIYVVDVNILLLKRLVHPHFFGSLPKEKRGTRKSGDFTRTNTAVVPRAH